jgi:hypothetical protein
MKNIDKYLEKQFKQELRKYNIYEKEIVEFVKYNIEINTTKTFKSQTPKIPLKSRRNLIKSQKFVNYKKRQYMRELKLLVGNFTLYFVRYYRETYILDIKLIDKTIKSLKCDVYPCNLDYEIKNGKRKKIS